MKDTKYKTGQLLVQLGHMVTWFRNQKLVNRGLTSGQAGVIGCLRKCADTGVTVGEVVEKLNRSKATVSEMLKIMEKKDLIQRFADPADARKIRIFLTEQGWGKEDDLRKVAEENEEIILAGMSEKEQKEFNRLLKIALNNMKRAVKMEREVND